MNCMDQEHSQRQTMDFCFVLGSFGGGRVHDRVSLCNPNCPGTLLANNFSFKEKKIKEKK